MSQGLVSLFTWTQSINQRNVLFKSEPLLVPKPGSLPDLQETLIKFRSDLRENLVES